jgi:hypothetical protein
MRPRDGFLYLLGHRESIQAVASSRASIPTGAVLVLLTAIARNYDQTHLTENPFRWLFGSLLFSFVSGAWLYAVAYGGFARRWMAPWTDEPRARFWSGWAGFLGLFWMTAPIAWLYAVPVERFLGDVPAARANVALLAVVSLWRVLLISRVLSVLCRVHLFFTLGWVLVAAAVEVLGVTLFGGGIAKQIMASMGGMRNSPAEEVLLGAMGTAFTGALLVAPVAAIASLLCRPAETPAALPEPQPGSLPWKGLLAWTAAWVAIAWVPQRELSNSVHYERLVRRQEWRAALDYLGARPPGDFAPARPLAPKPFEREIFTDLPPLLGAARATDPAWVRAHLIRRLDDLTQHLNPPFPRRKRAPLESWKQHVERLEGGLRWVRIPPADWSGLLRGANGLPEGRAWLGDHPALLEALGRATAGETWKEQRRSEWTEAVGRDLATTLLAAGATNAALTNLLQRPAGTNAPAAR